MNGRAAPALLLAALIGAAGPAGAACRLALALAFDVSASVDAREYRLMMEGTAEALRDPQVRQAALSDLPVALAAYVWAGRREQAIAVDWVLIESETDLAEFADRLQGFPRPTGDPLSIWGGRTGVGAALAAGERLLSRAPVCDAQTIDLAGDGESNDGPASVRLEAVTVNALAVAGNMPLDYDGAVDGLVGWYEVNILQGPGAFALEAQGFGDFARAMRVKLLREFAPLLLGAVGGGMMVR
ncbi:DUF1194 domain-containing protein [Pararhodobacter zhoushanensis]|uniref:DUF1194 domain-containing protein n=1 Tax=Pararhodobacter zhoushanensis TaxID=2479545 RepID=UPI000F8CA0A4|nr:DUF1194 domain-containing protein [Pararhodobacter zhoushanensis]